MAFRALARRTRRLRAHAKSDVSLLSSTQEIFSSGSACGGEHHVGEGAPSQVAMPYALYGCTDTSAGWPSACYTAQGAPRPPDHHMSIT